jgi:hypothetical protein
MSKTTEPTSTAGRELENRASIPGRCRNIFLPHVDQPDSGVHPASHPKNIGGSLPGVKRPERKIDHSPPTNAEVKNEWNYKSTPPYVFTAWCFVKYRIRLHDVVLS